MTDEELIQFLMSEKTRLEIALAIAQGENERLRKELRDAQPAVLAR